MNCDKLIYVMLFKDANPRWDSDGIIFVKSSLHLLPGGQGFKDNGAFRPTITQALGPKEVSGRQIMLQQKAGIEGGPVETQDPGEEQKAVEDVIENQGSSDNKVSEDEGKASDEGEANHANLVNDDPRAGTPIYDRLGHSGIDDTMKPEGDEKAEPTMESTYTPDLSDYDTGSIAIFEQTGKRQTGHFRFSGYHKITRLQYLAPQSADLYRMLEQKFSTVDRFGRVKQRQRSAASWEASMNLTWAVVKMEPDDEANAEIPPPKTKVRGTKGEGSDMPKKTVNELLQEMRMTD